MLIYVLIKEIIAGFSTLHQCHWTQAIIHVDVRSDQGNNSRRLHITGHYINVIGHRLYIIHVDIRYDQGNNAPISPQSTRPERRLALRCMTTSALPMPCRSCNMPSASSTATLQTSAPTRHVNMRALLALCWLAFPGMYHAFLFPFAGWSPFNDGSRMNLPAWRRC